MEGGRGRERERERRETEGEHRCGDRRLRVEGEETTSPYSTYASIVVSLHRALPEDHRC